MVLAARKRQVNLASAQLTRPAIFSDSHRMQKPTLSILLLTAFGIGFFCQLGFWQLRRATEKTAMFADFSASDGKAAMDFTQASAAMREKRYARTIVQGEFSADPVLLLDSQRADGQIGVGVFSVFFVHAPETPALLVARGFVPIKPDRSAFPQIETPSGVVSLQGILAPPPSSGIRLGKDQLIALDAARVLATRIEPEQIALRFNKPLLPYVLLLSPDAPHGFKRDWKPASFGPEKHHGYAITWFGLALTVLAVFLLLHWRRPASTSSL
jgi:surfeit locus 1 family protein